MATAEDTPAAATATAATTAHAAAAEDSATVRHPLDPLTGSEIEAATSILKRDRGLADSTRFVYVTLREPDKDTVQHHPAGRHQLHRRRPRGALAEVAIPGRLHPARRAGPAPAPVRGPWYAPAGHLPRLAGGDVHPLRRPEPRALPQERLRHGRIRHRGAGQQPGACCDCLGEIRYFDAWLNDNDGHAQVLVNAICLHEEDHGISWKHMDWRTGKTEVRRSRRLVISMIATVGNYEYGYFWYLYQDGTIEYEVKLTGVISNGALPPGQRPAHGTLVAPQVYGPHHQHIFCVRL